MLKSAESKQTFMERIANIHAPMSKTYRLIERAYDTAQREFKEKRRDTGEAYFEHLRAATIFAIDYLRVTNPNVICAILLHDIIEDISGWTFERVSAKFNGKIAILVWWVTKPEKKGRIQTDAEVDFAYYNRLRRAPRKAIIVKLCDRLHNLTTIWGQPRDRIVRKIEETQCYILPLARDHIILFHEFTDALAHIRECLSLV